MGVADETFKYIQILLIISAAMMLNVGLGGVFLNFFLFPLCSLLCGYLNKSFDF